VNNIHFGHFITESLVRLWAIDSLNETFKSVVFYKFSTNHEVPNFVFDTIDLIAPGANISILEGPASFELLAVPQELKSGSYIYGHSAVRKMCRGLLSRLERRNGLEKVYVSRSRLGAGNGGLIYEELIDEYMQAEGYTVLYPEEMPIRDQLEIYSSAEKLVFADGSAVHLYALVAQPHQSVFVIWRRGKYSIFDWQIKTFGGPSVQGEACIEELWVPEKEPSPSYGKSVLNLGQLSSQLYDGGFISQSKWCGPSRDEIKKRLEDIIKETGLPYIQIAVPT
jgi:capsular polysaccharide biosynthesis protein